MATTSYRQERAVLRKENILRTAAEVFEEKGYHGATIEEIAHRLKLTKGSIYYYVESKQDLLFQCHEVAMSILIKRLEAIASSSLPARQKLREAIISHVDALTDEISIITVALQQEYALSREYRQRVVERRDEYEKLLTKIIQEGIDRGEFEPVNAKMVRFAILGAVNWIPHWYSSRGELSKQQIARFFADYLTRSLEKKDGAQRPTRDTEVVPGEVTGD